MRKLHCLLLLTFALVLSLACNESDNEPKPEPTSVELTTADFDFSDWGIARVENLDPSDFGNPEPTHVNYAVVLINTGLKEVQHGDKNFFGIDWTIDSEEITTVIFNFYAPITIDGGTAGENLLGGASERTFTLADFSAAEPGPSDYFYLDATLIKQSLVDHEEDRNFVSNEGTITLSGTAPDFTLQFDLIMRDQDRNIDATFTGNVSGVFKIIEND